MVGGEYMNQKKYFSELRIRAFLFNRNIILTLSLIMFANSQSFAATNVTAGTSNYNISASSAGGTAFTSANNLILNGWGNPTYTLTANVQCVDLTLDQSVRLIMNGYTLRVTGNLVISDNNGMQIDLGSGGQLLVTGNATIGSSCGITGSGACLFQVGGAALTANFNNTFITLGASGTLKVAGNVTVGSSNTITVGTMEMSGCGQNMDVSSAFSVTTFRQSASCGTTITRSGGTSTITITNYDQNHNSVNIKPGSNFSVTTTINTSCTRTWDGGGGDNNWTTAANWVGDVAPVAGDDLVFTGSTRTTPYNDFTAGTTFNSISLIGANGASSNFSLSGNNFTLSGGTTAITNSAGTAGVGGYDLTINNNITFSTAAPTLTLATTTANGINLAGTVDNGGYTITINNTGSNTNFHLTGNISGSGGLVLNGPAIVMISGTNTYSGGTTINAGAVKFNSNQPMGVAGASVIVNGGSLDSYSSNRTLPDYVWTLNANFAYAGSNRALNLGAGSITLNTDITFDVQSNTFTIGGVISGAHNIIKTGNGTLYLGGSNTFTGSTTVNAGVLQLGNSSALGTVAGNTIIAIGAALDLNGINYSTAEPLTINGTGITSAGAIINSSTTAATFAGLITLGSASSILASNGDISLSNTGTILGNTYGLTLGGSYNGTLASILGTGTGILTKQDAGTWTLSAINTATGITTISAGILTLGGTSGNVGGNITNNATLNLTQTNASLVTVSAVISGTGAITSTAVNTALSGNNAYSGLTTLNSGKIAIMNNNALGTTSSGTVLNSSSTLIIYGSTYTYAAEPLTINGTATLRTSSNSTTDIGTYTGPITLGSNTTFSAMEATDVITISGVISGSYNVTTAGLGTVIFGGTNNYVGTTTISAGTLKLGAAGVIPDASGVTVTGTLDMNTFNETVGSISGAGTINNISGGGTPVLTCGEDNTSTTFSGSIQNTSGTVSLTKKGTGALTLSGSSSYSGTSTISAGTILVEASVALNTNSPLGNAASAVILGDANTTTNNSTPQLKLNGAYTFARPITIADQATSGFYYIGGTTDNNATFSGLITFNQSFSVTQVATTGGNTLTISGGITGGKAGTNTFYFDNAGSINVTTTAISNGSGTTKLGKSGIGTTTLSVANTYTGQTFIQGGILKAGVATSAFGSNSYLYMDNTSGVALDITGYNNNIGSITGGGTTGGNITLGAATLTVGGDNTSPAAFDGIISGTGSLTKTGSGTITLSKSNTYTGTTSVSAGFLVFKSLYASTAVDISTGAILELNTATQDLNNSVSCTFTGTGTLRKTGSYEYRWGAGIATFNFSSGSLIDVVAGRFVGGSNSNDVWTNNYADLNVDAGASFSGVEANVRVDALTGAGTINSGYSGGSGSFTFGVDGGSATFSGVLDNGSAARAFTKIGNGTQILTGTNLQTGTLTISAGVLQVGASSTTGSISSASVVNNASLIIDRSDTITCSSAISGNGTLEKKGTGMLTLSGNNSYSGTTTVSAGTLQLNNTAALGTNAAGTTVASGATIDLNGITYATTEALTINNTGVLGGGAVINSGSSASYAGAVTLGSDATITTANQITLSGTISPSTYSLTKAGANSLIFTSNTISVKDLTISAGTLVGGSSAINVYGNFTNSGTFTANTNGVNFLGSSSQAIPATSYNNLTINNSAGATLSGNISVGGTLTMTTGILNTGSYTVDLGSTGILSEANPSVTAPTSYITGNVKATRLLMRNVQNTFGGIGVDITDANLTNNSTIVIRSTGTSCTAFGHNSIKRYYTITPATDAGLNASFVFHYFDNEIIGTEANYKLYKSYNSRVNWYIQLSSSVNTANNTITQNGITDFSDWTGSDVVSQTLPIELLSFTTNKKGTGVSLEWTTASETNNQSFLLERSTDGVNWSSIFTCDGAGTSTEVHRYLFIDNNPTNGTNYYRLKQTDIDGLFTYSSIKSVSLAKDSLLMQIYPIPASAEKITVEISSFTLCTASISVIDIMGQEICTGDIELSSSPIQLKLADICSLIPGSYYIIISNNNMVVRKKITIW